MTDEDRQKADSGREVSCEEVIKNALVIAHGVPAGQSNRLKKQATITLVLATCQVVCLPVILVENHVGCVTAKVSFS